MNKKSQYMIGYPIKQKTRRLFKYGFILFWLLILIGYILNKPYFSLWSFVIGLLPLCFPFPVVIIQEFFYSYCLGEEYIIWHFTWKKIKKMNQDIQALVFADSCVRASYTKRVPLYYKDKGVKKIRPGIVFIYEVADLETIVRQLLNEGKNSLQMEEIIKENGCAYQTEFFRESFEKIIQTYDGPVYIRKEDLEQHRELLEKGAASKPEFFDQIVVV